MLARRVHGPGEKMLRALMGLGKEPAATELLPAGLSAAKVSRSRAGWLGAEAAAWGWLLGTLR